jgi:Tol biopolymer transport system component
MKTGTWLGLVLSSLVVMAGCGSGSPLQITTTRVANGVRNTAYSAPLTASGGAEAGYTWSVTGRLPAGLTVAADGTPGTTLAGTPTEAGNFPFKVTVTDADGNTDDASFTLVITTDVERLQVVTTNLGAATLGEAYSAQVTAEGGRETYTWRVSQGVLPAGLTLSDAGSPSATLSGTPTEAGQFAFTVEVSDGATTAAAPLTLVVNAVGQPLVIAPVTLAPADERAPYSATLTAMNGTGAGYTWSISGGALPAGLALAPEGTPSTTLSGTPTEDGTFTFTVQVQDSGGGLATLELSLMVTPSPLLVLTSSVPDGSVAAPYEAILEGAGGADAAFAWTVTAGALPGGLTLEPSGTPATRLAGTPTEAGTFAVTVTLQDGAGATATRDLTLVIQPALQILTSTLARPRVGQAYAATVGSAGGAGRGHQWQLLQGGLPAGLGLADDTTPTLAIAGTPTEFGAFPLTLGLTDAHGGQASWSVTLRVDPVAVRITTTTVALGTQSLPYLTVIETADGSGQGYAWSVQGALPPGLALDPFGVPNTGISGIPTTFGTFTATVSVTDTNGDAAARAFTFQIAPPPVFIVTASVAAGRYGRAVVATLEGAQGAEAGYRWAVSQGSLPFGLTLEPDGTPFTRITGVPQETGAFTFTVTLTDANGVTAARAYTMDVTRDLAIETRALATAELGTPYFTRLEAVGGTPPYTFSLAGGALPTGLSLGPVVGGVTDLIGLPTVTEAARFTLQVQDGAGTVATRSFMLPVRDLQRLAAVAGDTVSDNDGMVIIAEILGDPANWLTINPPANGFGDVSTGAGDVAFSPDNRKIAFIGDFRVDGVSELFVVDLFQGFASGPQVASGPQGANGDVLDFVWSPDSSRLLYSSDELVDGVNELFVVDVSGATPGPAAPVSPILPAFGDVSTQDFWWSPDGRWALMLADVAVDGDLELWAADLGGALPAPAVPLHPPLPVGSDVDDGLVFVPDGSAVIFLADLDAPDDHNLYLVDLSGAGPGPAVRLNRALPAGGDVSFDDYGLSPDGRRLFYVADQAADNDFELFLVEVSTVDPTVPLRVSGPMVPGADVAGAAWAPDSLRLAFAADAFTDGSTELLVVDLSALTPGAPLRANAPLLPGDRDVVGTPGTGFGWSPDGNLLAYRADSTVDDANDLFIARLTATGTAWVATRLNPDLDPLADVDNFSFAPDSLRIAYRADQNLANQVELFVVDLSGPTPGLPQQVNGPMVAGGDVDAAATSLTWSRDGARLFFEADAVVDNNFEAWVSTVSGPAPAPPIQVNTSLPAGGDVSSMVVQR